MRWCHGIQVSLNISCNVSRSSLFVGRTTPAYWQAGMLSNPDHTFNECVVFTILHGKRIWSIVEREVMTNE